MKICKTNNTQLACIDSQLPTLASVRKNAGYDATMAYLEAWIVNLTNFINVGKSMSDEQIYMTSELILQEYPFLNLADINLIFKWAKMGKYGQFYDRIDGQLILSWFSSYFENRCSICADREINNAWKFKGDNTPSFEKITELANKKRF